MSRALKSVLSSMTEHMSAPESGPDSSSNPSMEDAATAGPPPAASTTPDAMSRGARGVAIKRFHVIATGSDLMDSGEREADGPAANISRGELIRRLEELRPEFSKIMRQLGAHDPNWEPLEGVLMGDFMFMGYYDGKLMYKHAWTRRYLHLDEARRAYRWLGESRGYESIPLEEAIAHAFEDAEALRNLPEPGDGGPAPSRKT